MEQELVYRAASTHVDLDTDDVQLVMRGLREAGFEVRPPRFWVHENHQRQWFVIRGDGTGEGDHVVCYEPTHPDPKGAAEAEAARLNGRVPDA